MKRNTLTRREVLGLLAVGSVGMALASCGSTPEPTKAPTKAATPVPQAATPTIQKLVKLVHWMHLAPPNPIFLEMVNIFNSKYKGQIEVEFQEIPWNNYHQQLVTAIAAGSAPDTVRLVHEWSGEFWKAKWVLPLDPFIDKWDGKKNYPDVAYNDRRAGPGQPVVELPYVVNAQLLYYRRDWFEAEGIKPPTTVDEFVAACKAIARPKENRWAYALRGARNGQVHWNPWIYANGGQWLDDKGNVVIDSPQAIAGAQMQVDLLRKWAVVRPDAVSDDWPQLIEGFQTNKIAMLNHGIHVRNLIVQALGDKVAPLQIPKGIRQGNSKAISGPAIMANTKYPDAAWEWVKFWGTKEAAEMYLANKVEDMVPENVLVAEDPKFKNDIYFKTTLEMSLVPDYTPNSHPQYGPLLEKLWSPTMQKALLGEITPEQQMKTYADFMKQST